MSIKLYGVGPSRSFRCMWALEEAQLDYEFIALQLGSPSEGGSQTSDYLTLNQQGKVPCMVHDEFILSESAAIVNYINELSATPFIPTQAHARARYDELSFFILTELEQPLWSNGKHRFALPEEQRIEAMLETAAWEFTKALKALDSLCKEARLAMDNEFALGNEFSFCDVLLAQTLNWAERFKFTVPQGYLYYRDRMYARPAAVQASKKIG